MTCCSAAEFAVRRPRVSQLETVDGPEFPSLEEPGIHARLSQQTQVPLSSVDCQRRWLDVVVFTVPNKLA